MLRLPDKSTARALLSDDRLVRVSTSGRVLGEVVDGDDVDVGTGEGEPPLQQSSADSGLRWEDVHVYHAPAVASVGGGVARRESQRHSTRGTLRVAEDDVGALNASDDEGHDTWRGAMGQTASSCVNQTERPTPIHTLCRPALTSMLFTACDRAQAKHTNAS